MAQNPRIFDSTNPSIPIHDPQLAPTVFQVIQRTGILYPVIEDLKLQDKWTKEGNRPSREQAYQLLRRKLDVDEVRNTDLLQISVFSVDPQEAADIANKIVAVYQDKRVEEEKDILNRAVTTMNEEVAKQQKAVADAGTEVARIRDEEHIVDLNPEGKEDTEAPVNAIVVKQESEVNEAETEEATLANKLKQIENVSGDELIRMLPTLNPTLDFKREAAIAKLHSSDVAMTNAREATQIHGGYGFMNETPVGRMYRDAKILEIGEGTSEVQRMVIGGRSASEESGRRPLAALHVTERGSGSGAPSGAQRRSGVSREERSGPPRTRVINKKIRPYVPDVAPGRTASRTVRRASSICSSRSGSSRPVNHSLISSRWPGRISTTLA